NVAVEGFRRGVGEIQNLDPVQMSDVTIRFDNQQVIVPVGGMNHRLIFGRGPCDTLPSIAIQAAGVVVKMRIDFELPSLRESGRTGIEMGMREHAAIARPDTLESQRKMEILVLFFGPEIAVFFGDSLSVDIALVNVPLLVPDLHPAGEILTIK